MKVRRMGRKWLVRLPRARVLWVSVLTGLIAFAVVSQPGARTVFAQSTGTQAGVSPTAGGAPSGDSVQAAPPEQSVKHEADGTVASPRKKQVAEDTANLLKLANGLKAEVAKFTPDTMSVPVIRQAEEIEKLARKMRSK